MTVLDYKDCEMDQDNHPIETIGGILIGIGAVVCAMEIVPGWEAFNLGLPHYVYFLVGPTASALGLYLCYREYPIPAIVAGAVGGLGAMMAISALLHLVVWVHSAMLASAGLFGALPGLGLGWFLKMKMYDADEQAEDRQRYEREVAMKLGWPVEEYEDKK